MGRIAGDSPGYEFRMCRIGAAGRATATRHGFTFESVTEVIHSTLGAPAGAMAWHGFRLFRDGIAVALQEDYTDVLQHADDVEQLEEFMKARGVAPHLALKKAGDRGTDAHKVVECLAEGWKPFEVSPTAINETTPGPTLRDWAEALAMNEEFTDGTRYGWAAIEWWDTEVQPMIDAGRIRMVLSEVPVISLDYKSSGTFDVALLWFTGPDDPDPLGWEVVDAKTHKPADGFTKDGKGPAYPDDLLQCKTYRRFLEEMAAAPHIFRLPPGLPPGAKTIGQRVVVLRDRAYRGKTYLEDTRELPFRLFELIREVHDIRQRFEKGVA